MQEAIAEAEENIGKPKSAAAPARGADRAVQDAELKKMRGRRSRCFEKMQAKGVTQATFSRAVD
jgi:hypothetical protein